MTRNTKGLGGSRRLASILAMATGLAALGMAPATGSADERWGGRHDGRRDQQIHVSVNLRDDNFCLSERRWVPAAFEQREVRVWVEPVYRTACDRVWVEPVYRTVCDRVWREPVTQTVCERVWVPDRWESREVVYYEGWRRCVERRQVLVEPGHFTEIRRVVEVSPGRWETIERKELVSEGGWQTVERREVAVPGHWETRVEQVQVCPPHMENRPMLRIGW
jgi:hypothetical protein